MKAACWLSLLITTFVQAAPRDLVWKIEETLTAGQELVVPYEVEWPKQQASLVAVGATGALPDGVNCKFEVMLQHKRLLQMPCSTFYQLKRPVRIVPAMKLQLRLYNASFSSPGAKVVLRNRIKLDLSET